MKVLPLHVAQFRQMATENLQVGTPRTGTKDFQPADPRNPGSFLRVQGRYGEQIYGNDESRHSGQHVGHFHLHCMPLVGFDFASFPQAAGKWLDYSTFKKGRCMSESGHSRRIGPVCNISALPPESRRRSGHRFAPLSARSRPEQVQHIRSGNRDYSITSLARASTDTGTSMPSDFAVLRLISSSYLVGACTGRSAGFSPLRMRLT